MNQYHFIHNLHKAKNNFVPGRRTILQPVNLSFDDNIQYKSTAWSKVNYHRINQVMILNTTKYLCNKIELQKTM